MNRTLFTAAKQADEADNNIKTLLFGLALSEKERFLPNGESTRGYTLIYGFDRNYL